MPLTPPPSKTASASRGSCGRSTEHPSSQADPSSLLSRVQVISPFTCAHVGMLKRRYTAKHGRSGVLARWRFPFGQPHRFEGFVIRDLRLGELPRLGSQKARL